MAMSPSHPKQTITTSAFGDGAVRPFAGVGVSSSFPGLSEDDGDQKKGGASLTRRPAEFH
jgi:hypothetical protein